jgi:glutamyl-tRNA reductase
LVGISRACPRNASQPFDSFDGLHVLVPSSGDNGAVFAFHMLGASVTSADISERQLENAKKLAR